VKREINEATHSERMGFETVSVSRERREEVGSRTTKETEGHKKLRALQTQTKA
jgi:hypothetical protein